MPSCSTLNPESSPVTYSECDNERWSSFLVCLKCGRKSSGKDETFGNPRNLNLHLIIFSLCYNYHYAVSEYELTHYDITGNLFPPSMLPPWRPRVNWLLLHSSAPCRDGPGSGKRAAVIKRLICEESNRERERGGGRLALEDRKGILDISSQHTSSITWNREPNHTESPKFRSCQYFSQFSNLL